VVLQHLLLSPDPTPLLCHPASHNDTTALKGCCCPTSPQQQQQQQQHVRGSAPAELSCSQQQSPCCNTHHAPSLLQQQQHQLWPAQLSWMIQRQQKHNLHLLHTHNQQQLSMQSHPYQQKQQQQQQQQQQVRGYHPATHAARSLTSKLLQQKSWQDLQQIFQAAGGGSRLNPIQLCALLQQLARLAPPAELLPAAEKGQLRGFADQVGC